MSISDIKRLAKAHPRACAFAVYLGIAADAISFMYQPDAGPERYANCKYVSDVQTAYDLTDDEALGLVAHVLSKVKGAYTDEDGFHVEWLDPQDPFVLAFGLNGTWLGQVEYVMKTF